MTIELHLCTFGGANLRAFEGDADPSPDIAPVLTSSKPLALIVYLHATGGAATREQLVDQLWADVAPVSGRHTLRQTLWYLRKRLGGQPFTADGELVRLVAPVSSDRTDFLTALDGGDAERAFALYTGDFMPGFASPGAAAFEQWADLERQRLRALFIGAAGRVVRASLEAGRAREALAAARRARDLAPTSQATWRMVIESLLAADDLVGAKAEAERLLALLAADELEPEPATEQLLRVVERGRPRGPAEQEPRTLAAELVGRDAAFATLLQAFERAARGTPQHVHVSGPAGLGKSRLIEGLAARVRSQRGQKARVVLVRATPAERTLAFAFAGQLVNALVPLRGAAAVSRDTAETLVALAPTASTYLDVPPDRSTGDEALRRRMLAVSELVAAVADDAPLALLIDDVHWMDQASRTVVAALAERLQLARVCIVTTGRGADGFAELVPSAAHLPLAPLTVDHVTALVSSVAALPSVPWAELFPARLTTATNGSPLLITETLQLALERGQLAVVDNSWHCDAPDELLSLLGRGHALHQRLTVLPATARDVLLALALAGEALNEDTVRRVVGVDVHEALSLLDQRGLVLRGGEWWRPAHDEIAALAADLASARDRVQTHTALADWIEAQSTAPRAWNATRALWHRWRAGDWSGAQRVARRLIDQLRAEGDTTDTARLLREALGSDATDDDIRRLANGLPSGATRLPGRLPWVLAAASLAALVVIGARSTRSAGPVTNADVSLVIQLSDSTGDTGQWVRADVALDALGAATSVELARTTAPVPQAVLDSVVDLQPLPSVAAAPARFVGTRLRTDRPSYALDLVQVDADGTMLSLLEGPRDQALPQPSPTGSLVAFVDRAHWPSQAGDLSLVELSTGRVSRLTDTPADEKIHRWSPDGRQLAFLREFADSSSIQLCRLNLAARVEQCVTFPADHVPAGIRAWRHDDDLLVETVSRRTSRNALVRVHADGTRLELIDEGATSYAVDPNGEVVLCECRLPGVDRPVAALIAVEHPRLRHPLRLGGRLVTRVRHVVQLWTVRPLLLSRLRIVAPDSAMVGEQLRLGATGQDARGRDVAVTARRWTVLDTTLARVDSSGMLQLLATGVVRVVLRDGNRLADTARIRSIAPRFRTVLTDDFSAPAPTEWYLLGSPPPVVRRSSRGPFLHINGDDRLSSGVVSRLAWPAGQGVGVRVRFRLPIDRHVWQRLEVMLEPVANDSVLDWLQRHPDEPIPAAGASRANNSCAVYMPRSEGGAMRGVLGLYAAGLSVPTRRTTPPFGDGAVHEAEVQVYADGRCAFSLDGALLGMSEEAIRLDRPLRVHLTGQSVGTIVEVERVEVWTGVRTRRAPD